MATTRVGKGGEVKEIPPYERHIQSSNCIGRCILNIPQGIILLFLPGFGMLLIGIIIFAWTSSVTEFHTGITLAGMILLILGAILTGGGVVYWIYSYCQMAPKTPSKGAVSPYPKPLSKDSVTLVGVYRIRQDGFSIPDDSYFNANGPHGIYTIS